MSDEPEQPEDATQNGQEPGELARPGEPLEAANSQAIPSEILDKLPPEARHLVEFSMMQMGPTPNPLLKHVNANHIDKALDNAEKTDARQAEAHKEEVKDRKHNRITTWAGAAVLALLLGGLWIWVPSDKLSSLHDVIKTLITLAGVAFGGYGVALAKTKDKE